MKTACYILLVFWINSSVNAQQFYIRGEVKDETGNPLSNVTILHNRTGYLYKTGSLGTFGIINSKQTDSLTFSFDGYRTELIIVNADNYVTVRLKLQPFNLTNVRRDQLASLTRNFARDEQRKWFSGEESYASIIENRFVSANRFPNTDLSLNIDRASYSNIRRMITQNSLVPPDAVRIEEMLNYFNLNYQSPAPGDVFLAKTTLTDCPWNSENQLFFIDFSSKKINLDSLPPTHLVFLIDVSGSMDLDNRLPLLKSAFKLLVSNLRDKDSVSIVVYGGITGVMLNATGGREKEVILKAIDELAPGGSTPGESGIRMAYNLARVHYIKGGNNRVILATDGDFNVGLKSETELDELITRHRESGVYLTCLGVGMGNYKDSKIQTLARKGNGNFAYIDNFREGEKILLKEFTKTLYAVADDVYMNVAFNPEYVKEYRLIGFDNKMGALKDSLSVIDGGEVGPGHTMQAVFEIEPFKACRDAISNSMNTGIFAEVRLQYRNPNDTVRESKSFTSRLDFVPFDQLDKSYRFAASVIMFGSLLKESPYIRNASWNDVLSLAQANLRQNDKLQEEFVSLVQQAKSLYSKIKKKKGNLTYK